jgi:hypothetical protein
MENFMKLHIMHLFHPLPITTDVYRSVSTLSLYADKITGIGGSDDILKLYTML